MAAADSVTQGESVPVRPRRWLRAGLVWLAVLGGSTVLVVAHDGAFHVLSPYDEMQHIDYVDRLLSWRLLRRGDQLGQEAMEAGACRRVIGWPAPPCDASVEYDPTVYPWAGINTADVHPPTYYFLTSIPVRGYLLAGLDLTTAARWVGGIWLGLGVLALWWSYGQLRIGRLQRMVVALLLLTSPTVLVAVSSVNPDASSLLAGGLMVAGLVAWERQRVSTLALTLANALAVALKLTNVLVVAAAVVYLLLRWAMTRKEQPRLHSSRLMYRTGILALVVGATVAAGGWLLIHGALKTVQSTPQTDFLRVDSLEARSVAVQLDEFLTPVREGYVPPFLRVTPFGVLDDVTNVMLIAGAIWSVFQLRRDDSAALLTVSAFVAAPLGAIGLVLANYLGDHTFADLPSRYGIGLLPFMALGLARLMSHPVPTAAGATLAVGSAAVLVVQLIRWA